MKFKGIVVLFSFCSSLWPLGCVHAAGQERFESSREEMHNFYAPGSFLRDVATAKAAASKSSNGSTVLKTVPSHLLTHTISNSTDQGRRRHLQAGELGRELISNDLRSLYGAEDVSISADGSRIAVSDNAVQFGTIQGVGSVFVFKLVADGTLEPLGDPLDGEAGGSRVALSADGRRLVVGANDVGNGRGLARVFEEPSGSDSAWIQIGNDIRGKARGDNFGADVGINSDGSRIIVGAVVSDGDGVLETGSVCVFREPTGSGSAWIQIGIEIWFGRSVAMSANGSRIAVGALFDNGNDGSVRVASLAMSADGSRIAVGAPSFWNQGGRNPDDMGRVRVFEQPMAGNSTRWTKIGNDIKGKYNYRLMATVSLLL